MKVHVAGVHNFPEKSCFKVIFDRPVKTLKMQTYGVGMITEKFCSDPSLLGKFTSAVGKELDVSFDMSGKIVSVIG